MPAPAGVSPVPGQVVQPDLFVERRIERWKPGREIGEIHTTTIEWAPAGVPEPLRIDLPALFTRVLG